jgi:hypothetical protein
MTRPLKKRTDGLFTKDEHPTPQMRAKISAGVAHYYREHPRPLSPKNAALEEQAKRNLEWVHNELVALRARGIK